MGKVLPIILATVGLGAGIGAGLLLRPDKSEEYAAVDCAPSQLAEASLTVPAEPATPSEFIKLSNQFIVPVLDKDDISSLIVLSLSLEVDEGMSRNIIDREPKLRDAFLRVMFDHANTGGFDGNFLESTGLDVLRAALLESALKITGDVTRDVLIVDLVRQDA